MTPQEAILVLNRLKAEIEWDLSLEYQGALDEAIAAVKFKERIEECEKKYCPGKQKAINALRQYYYEMGISGIPDDELWETILYKWRFEDADKREPIGRLFYHG